MSFVFSDMLGNHLLATSVQATSRLDEFGGSVFYLNRTHRWNWGLQADQTPYVAGSFSAAIANIQGQNVYVEQELRLVQRYQSVSAVATYPFSRAWRMEATGGYHRIGLKEDLTTRIFDVGSGQQLSEDKQDVASVPTVNFGEVSSALVYDTSIFGATSPIRGTRYRLELSQSGGGLTYTGVLGDARTYVMPIRPYTLAFRGLYYGRYGRDSDDGRLPTLYLGYPGLVRGYDSGSFESFECGNHPDGSCPVFDRLIGSRVAIANAELRFPPWAAFGGSGFYGPVPVELAFFADAGVAWGNNTRTFSDTIRKPRRQRRRRGARERVRLCCRRDRLRPAARSPGPRLAVAVQSATRILANSQTCRVQGAACKVRACTVHRAGCSVLCRVLVRVGTQPRCRAASTQHPCTAPSTAHPARCTRAPCTLHLAP